jgi:hypothetical protein
VGRNHLSRKLYASIQVAGAAQGQIGGGRCNYRLRLEREERERRQQSEQARIGRLLDEAALLRRASDICAYVDAVLRARPPQCRRKRSSGGRSGRLRKPIVLTR